MSSFNFIAILGRQAELGLVELESVLGPGAVEAFGPQAALLTEAPDLTRLGGTVKLARVLYSGLHKLGNELPVDPGQLPLGDGKTPFAVSVYAPGYGKRQVEALGLTLKKALRTRGSVRLVMPTEGPSASAAVLKHNGVIQKGFELVVVSVKGRLVVAITTAVQDIDAYAARDYGRPARSATVGMLPPKLAQILINATRSEVVADPFCGTGVVLQEARLMGRTAWGRDLSPEMVTATATNMEWLQHQEVERPLGVFTDVAVADARTVVLPTGCAVVSEGYLGPNLMRDPAPAELASIKAELKGLYADALASWAGQLPRGAEVALCVPAWRQGRGWSYLELVDELPALGYTLKGFQTAPTPLLYARDNQTVGRQLLFMRKN